MDPTTKVEVLSMVISGLCACLSIGLSLYIGIVRYVFSQEKTALLEKIEAAKVVGERQREEYERVRTQCVDLEKRQERLEQARTHQAERIEEIRADLRTVNERMLTKEDYEASMERWAAVFRRSVTPPAMAAVKPPRKR